MTKADRLGRLTVGVMAAAVACGLAGTAVAPPANA